MTRGNFDIAILPNGDLEIRADAECLEEVAELRARDRGDDDILMELTESYWTNGSFHPFDAGAANPFVGLTDAPCIAETLDCHDDGKWEIVGQFWHYGDYMLKSYVDEILRNGRVVFQLAR